jgi:hypothetical protein
MHRLARSTAIGMALVLTMAGCSSSWFNKKEPPTNPNLFPTNYRKEVLDTMKESLTVNTNVRDAYISEPVLTQVDQDQRYTVCVRSNSRDINGEYTGDKDRIAYFYGGHLNQLVLAKPGQCANAAYKPFPELEHICQAEKCQ